MAQLRDTEVSEEAAVADYHNVGRYYNHYDNPGPDYDHHAGRYDDGNPCFHYHDYDYVALVFYRINRNEGRHTTG